MQLQNLLSGNLQLREHLGKRISLIFCSLFKIQPSHQSDMFIIQSDILNGYSSVEIFQCIKMWLNQRIIK